MDEIVKLQAIVNTNVKRFDSETNDQVFLTKPLHQPFTGTGIPPCRRPKACITSMRAYWRVGFRKENDWMAMSGCSHADTDSVLTGYI